MEEEQIKRSRRTSEEIKALLASFTKSDMGAKAFCKMHGISEGVFYKWKARHLNKPLTKQPAFVTLQPASVGLHESPLFAEVKGIKIYQVVSACFLKELIA